MEPITLELNQIIYNNIFLAFFGALLSLLILFIDRCIFIKKHNYITYIKLFLLIFILIYLILLFKDTNTPQETNLNIDNSPFK